MIQSCPTRRELLGRCLAPCAAGLITPFRAAAAVEQFRRGGRLYRRLGRTDLFVSLLSFGSHTDPTFRIKDGDRGTVPSAEGQARRNRQIARAFDLGVNLLDVYEREGQWEPAAKLVRGRRDRVLISLAHTSTEAQSGRYSRHMDEGERFVKAKQWEKAGDEFRAALEVLPGDRKATDRLSACERRLHPALAGFDDLGEPDDATGLPRRARVSGTSRFMALVPAGEFDMGSERFASARPVHTVSVETFYLGQFEITQAQWESIVGTNPSAHQSKDFPEADRMPVEQISSEDAEEFVRKLNERVPAGGFRLPTEAEWEYAARSTERRSMGVWRNARGSMRRIGCSRRNRPAARRPASSGCTTCRATFGSGAPIRMCPTRGPRSKSRRIRTCACCAAEDLRTQPTSSTRACATALPAIANCAGTECASPAPCRFANSSSRPIQGAASISQPVGVIRPSSPSPNPRRKEGAVTTAG